jgi:hypothetical protein
MSRSSLRILVVLTFAGFDIGQALAASSLRLQNDASVVVQIQDDENKELWQDLRPDVTPPEAAVGNEGPTPRSWEKAMTDRLRESCRYVGCSHKQVLREKVVRARVPHDQAKADHGG